MKPSRRNILALIGATPLAAREALETKAMSLAGVAGPEAPTPPYGMPAASSDPTKQQIISALRIPSVREEMRSLLFEEHQRVGYLDHDLASKRSFSLAAKIVFQRQRNIERRLVEMQTEYTWNRINQAILRALGLSRP